jgi:hypothetical protein
MASSHRKMLDSVFANGNLAIGGEFGLTSDVLRSLLMLKRMVVPIQFTML